MDRRPPGSQGTATPFPYTTSFRSMAIAAEGRGEFLERSAAGRGEPLGEIAKLVVTLKVRFLHLLPAEFQREQVSGLIALYEREIARLAGLRADHAGEAGHLGAWLDHDIAQ